MRQANGAASVWSARRNSVGQERELAAAMVDAHHRKHQKVLSEATAPLSVATPGRPQTQRRLRGALHPVRRRGLFPSRGRDAAWLSRRWFDTVAVDPALWRLARVVHAPDIDGGRYDALESPGFDGAYEFLRREHLLGREPA